MTDKEKIRAEIEIVVNRRLNLLNGDYFDLVEEVSGFTNEITDIIDSLQKESKECMYSKDNYTDEDRKVLCEDCKEKCEYNKKEESASDDEIEKQFKVGDIVVYMSRHPAYSGLYLLGNPNDLSIGYSNANEPYQIALRNCTVASEDERRQFMRELNDNGYKWNEVTLRIDKKEKPVSGT